MTKHEWKVFLAAIGISEKAPVLDIPGHALYEIYDAPDYAAIQGMTMEPEILAWSSFNTMRVLPVTSVDEVNAFLQQPASQA